MVQVQDAIFRGGQIVIDGLPFRDGEHVRVSVAAAPAEQFAPVKRSIDEVRRIVAGSSDQLDDPGEPMIPVEDWDMLKNL